MADGSWLVDKSALVRLARSPDNELWANRMERGLVRVTTLTLLEFGFSARSGEERREARTASPLAELPLVYIAPAVERRADEVQGLLADRGTHRGVPAVDLLIAASAEQAGLTVLHVDKDFELIADVTGQPVERLRLQP